MFFSKVIEIKNVTKVSVAPLDFLVLLWENLFVIPNLSGWFRMFTVS
jgi:hypothetical protein